MRILHYALGFPPYRSGGLTKFCLDLMKQQTREGHDVSLMWPGQMGFIDKNIKVIDQGYRECDDLRIRSYEVINPLPISYDEGIRDYKAFTDKGDRSVYNDFLAMNRVEVIHIHTLMGLHKAFLDEAKKRGIKLVFTAHDFFSVCPKVTMFRAGDICTDVEACSQCGSCNMTALSLEKIKLLQSPLYRGLKDSVVVKKLRKHHRDKYLSEEQVIDSRGDEVTSSQDYLKLRGYYKSMINLMDIIHYNSSLTRDVYERYLGVNKSVVIGISHENISDNRRIKNFSDDIIRLRYLGPCGGAKGYFYLKTALDRLWEEKQNFTLDIHFIPSEVSEYIRVNDRYSYGQLEEIFNDTDLLIAPSKWYETFGYTVLEALSFGVPVLITDRVGAKDILAEGAGIVVSANNVNDLYETIKYLDAKQLAQMNRVIVEKQKIMTLSEMSKEIMDKCYL